MKIKTYQAPTMQDAIKQIKAELGPDAVILSTRQVRATSGTMALLGRQVVEVTAAIDTTPSAKTPRAVPSPAAACEENSFQRTLQQRLNAERPASPETAGATAHLRQVCDQMREELERLRDAVEEIREERVTAAPAARAHDDAVTSEPRGRFHRYLDLVLPGRVAPAQQRAMDQPASRRTSGTAGVMLHGFSERQPASLESIYHRLTSRGLASEHARRLLSSLQSRGAVIDLTSESSVRQAARELLAQEIKTAGPVLGPRDRRKTVIMIGPTGAGKTTSIAKLAAFYRLQERRNVVLITLDTYRMAAVEQLRAYARLLHVPLEVALTKADALTFIREYDKAELVLIDTIGRSPRDPDGMEELKRLISLDHPVETHLVLSATTRQRDLLESFERFSEVPIHRLLFTKLDETTSYGALATVAQRTNVPLSYLGIGQEVPDDFLVAAADTVADLVLGASLPAPARSSEWLAVRGEGWRKGNIGPYGEPARHGGGQSTLSSTHTSHFTPQGS